MVGDKARSILKVCNRAQVPGLKVVMPTTAYDAKGMLVSAIEDNNPVIFIEHRWLYHIRDRALRMVALGQAKVLVEGDAVTLAAFSHMVVESLIAAGLMESMGINIVLDMRSL